MPEFNPCAAGGSAAGPPWVGRPAFDDRTRHTLPKNLSARATKSFCPLAPMHAGVANFFQLCLSSPSAVSP